MPTASAPQRITRSPRAAAWSRALVRHATSDCGVRGEAGSSAVARSASVSMSHQVARADVDAAHQPRAASWRMPPLSVVSPPLPRRVERAKSAGAQTNRPVSSAS